MRQNQNNAHICKLKFINYFDQSIGLSKHEIYPNSKNVRHFLNKLTFGRLISPKRTKLVE